MTCASDPDRYRVVVSAENSPYMAWQCKLFHFSCVSRLHRTPVFFVHESAAQELHAGFGEIVRASGIVHPAPSYALSAAGDIYLPRNTPGTLLHAAAAYGTQNEFFLLCDPDIIFLRLPAFPAALSGDHYSYIDFGQDFVEPARRALGLTSELIGAQKEDLRCGTPYVIPAGSASQLAETWLAAVDAFGPRRWEDVMYAFGLAAVKLGLRVTLTRFAETNYWPDAAPTADAIHYCYGDETWSKRQYFTEEQAREVWEPRATAPRGTVLGEILSQIQEARDFYRNPCGK
jgi:hypothetical protein